MRCCSTQRTARFQSGTGFGSGQNLQHPQGDLGAKGAIRIHHVMAHECKSAK
jgi:hypothetical protein